MPNLFMPILFQDDTYLVIRSFCERPEESDDEYKLISLKEFLFADFGDRMWHLGQEYEITVKSLI